MEQVTGKAILNKIGMGKLFFCSPKKQEIKRHKAEDLEQEIARYEIAKKEAMKELRQLHQKAIEEVGEEIALIFAVHEMILEDDDYGGAVRQIIRSEGVSAEEAVAKTGENFAAMFLAMKDECFRSRAADVQEVSERVAAILRGVKQTRELGDGPVIVVAEDLNLSEMLQMDRSKLKGIVMKRGSEHSHAAILARSMNIPTLMGVNISEDWNGREGILDGQRGLLFVDPDAAILTQYKQICQKEEEQKLQLSKLKGCPDQTKDGRQIHLYANIDHAEDVEKVLENDAAGIGLFRSEYLYLGREDYPTEEEQFQIYKVTAERMAGKKVVIRTADLGGDKHAEYLGLEPEENPAMGCRGIRISLNRMEMFKTQLRGVYRAAAFGNVSLLFPMIISVEEVLKIKQICGEVRAELEACGAEYGEVELGIMVETPAAVMISDLLAKEVDFMSIGTNDLTQYTLAVDRGNTNLDGMYDAHHTAILRMIRMVVEHVHKEQCRVGVCGELASDTSLTEIFLKMGVDELSVAPDMILPIRNIIINMNG